MKKSNSKDLRFWGMLVCGMILILIAMFTPPLSVIDSSVIFVVGQLTLLIGGLLECCVHIDIKNGYLHIGRMSDKEYSKIPKQIEETDEQKDTPSEP